MKYNTPEMLKNQVNLSKKLPKNHDELEIFVREQLKNYIISLFFEEVEAFCGEKYHPQKGGFHRSGSREKTFHLQGKEMRIKIPRVRKICGQKSTEHTLKMYQNCVDAESFAQQICALVKNGVSIRNVRKIRHESSGVSPSQVSRLFRSYIESELMAFRARDLGPFRFVGLFIDGVHFAKDIAVIIALGVTDSGEKIMLDFEVGSSESNTICDQLCGRLIARGFTYAARTLMVVLDGSKALRYGVNKHFPNTIIQTCLVHLQRNIYARLNHKDKSAIAPLWEAVFDPENTTPFERKLESIRAFLTTHSQNALKCLEYPTEEVGAFSRLNAAKIFERTFLSSNIIENAMNNVRSHTRNIKRWRTETLMPELWVGHCCVCAEKSFNRIRGYTRMNDLIHALNDYIPPL